MKSVYISVMIQILFVYISPAQEVKLIYYDGLWQEVKNAEKAKFFTRSWMRKDSLKNKVYLFEEYDINNTIRMQGSYLDKNKKVKDGKFVHYHKNGIIRSECFYSKNLREGSATEYYEDGKVEYKATYIHDRLNGEYHGWHNNGALKVSATYANDSIDGVFQTFYPDGKLLRKDVYVEGHFISGNCYSRNGLDTSYFPYKTLPVFYGGTSFQRYIGKNLKYPRRGSIYGVNGRAVVKFLVDRDGSVQDPVIMSSDNEIVNEEALRVVANSPRWIPGKTDGVFDRTYLEVAINFRSK